MLKVAKRHLHLATSLVLGVAWLGVALANPGGQGMGPAASFAFSEPGGTTTADLSGSGNAGTLINGVARVSGPFGGAVSFDGVDDGVVLPITQTLDLTTAFTIEAWMNPSNNKTRDARYVAQLTGTTGEGLWLDPHGTVHFAATFTSGYFSVAGTAVPTNAWTHVAVTHDGRNLRVYVNGAKEATVAVGGTLAPGPGAMWIGRGRSKNSFAGVLDEVRIYRRAIQVADILADMTTRVDTTEVSNQPPVVTGPADQTFVVGMPVWVQITASDPEGAPLIFGATGLPPGVSVDPVTGLLSGTLPMPGVQDGQAMLASGPEGYWRLDEASGTAAVDASGHGLTGTYVGGVTLNQPGALADGDAAIALNGIDGHVELAEVAIEAGSAGSVSVWADLSLGDGRTLLTLWPTSGQNKYRNVFEVWRSGSTDLIAEWYAAVDGSTKYFRLAGGTPELTGFHAITVTWTPTTANLYLDGREVGATSAVAPLKGGLYRLYAGVEASATGPSFNFPYVGGLDEVAIYNRALSATEVAQLHIAQRGTYAVTATASDGAWTASHAFTWTVTAAPNQPPVVSAGSNQTITLPASASLNGTATDDGLPTGSTLTRTWSRVSGPGTVAFGNINSPSTTASFSASGTYLLRLTATDGALTSTSTVTITATAISGAESSVYYVDSASGSDSNPGTIAQPWKTVAKVNNGSFDPGSSILFKRGQIWREGLNLPSGGSVGLPVTYGAYGSGSDPIISGSTLLTTGWSRDSANIWKTTVTTQPPVVFVNNTRGTSVAVKASITTEYQWYWAANVLYVWSPTDADPSTYYTSPGIEASQRRPAQTNNQSYVTLDHLTLRDGTDNNVNVGSAAVTGIVIQNRTVERGSKIGIDVKGTTARDSVTIANCTIRDNGGWGIWVNQTYTSATISGNTITGNGWGSLRDNQQYGGIQGYLGNANIFANTIYDNVHLANVAGQSHGIYVLASTAVANIYENIIYDHAQGDGIKLIGSATVSRNQIYGNYSSGIEAGQNGTVDVVYVITSNLIYANNKSGSANGITEQTKGTGTLGITLYNNTVYQNAGTTQQEIKITDDVTVLTLTNNLLWTTATRRTLGVNVTQTGAVAIDYNLHWRADGAPSIRWGSNYPTWTQWQALGYDVHGVNADPLFSSTPDRDFRLTVGSPAIDAGINIGLTRDIVDVAVPQSTAPDIGAYEWHALLQAGLSVPMCLSRFTSAGSVAVRRRSQMSLTILSIPCLPTPARYLPPSFQ